MYYHGTFYSFIPNSAKNLDDHLRSVAMSEQGADLDCTQHVKAPHPARMPGETASIYFILRLIKSSDYGYFGVESLEICVSVRKTNHKCPKIFLK